MDILASNDKRLYHEKVKRIRQLRPDMVLLSGGVDGGTISHVVELAEIIKNANHLKIGKKIHVKLASSEIDSTVDKIYEK